MCFIITTMQLYMHQLGIQFGTNCNANTMHFCVKFRQWCPGPSDIKKLRECFFSPQLILQKSNCEFQRKLSFSKVPEEVFKWV